MYCVAAVAALWSFLLTKQHPSSRSRGERIVFCKTRTRTSSGKDDRLDMTIAWGVGRSDLSWLAATAAAEHKRLHEVRWQCFCRWK
jgi:hypothetical protein